MPKIEVPHHYICPITHKLMNAPAKIADGQIFELSAVEPCLKNSDKNPITQKTLAHKKLALHLQLKNEITAFKEKHKICTEEEFFAAIVSNNPDDINKLSYPEYYLEADDKNGHKPLHLAAMKGLINSLCWLLKQKVDINSIGYMRSALHWACSEGQLEAAIILLDNHADTEVRAPNQATPLHDAVNSGHNELVKLLIARKANIDAKTTDGLSPLHFTKNQDTFITLLNAYATTSQTTLHTAASLDDIRSLEFLLGEKLSTKTKDNNGLTCLHTAAKLAKAVSILALIRVGADVNAVDNEGKTPLHHAAFDFKTNSTSAAAAVTCLLKSNANCELKDNIGRTALHMAVVGTYGISPLTIKALLNGKANIEATTKEGQTPLHLAANCGDVIAAQALLEGGANINAQDVNGQTPLHIAAMPAYQGASSLPPKKLDVAKLLLINGADYHSLDNNKCTPAQLAEKHNQVLANFITARKQELKIIKMNATIESLKTTVKQQQSMITQLTTQMKTLINQLKPEAFLNGKNQMELLGQISDVASTDQKPVVITPEDKKETNKISRPLLMQNNFFNSGPVQQDNPVQNSENAAIGSSINSPS